MEILLLLVDICAMFLLVRWSAKSETPLSKVKNPSSRASHPPTRPNTK